MKLVIYSPDIINVLQRIQNDEKGKPLFENGIKQIRQSKNGDYVVNDIDRVVCVSSDERKRWEYNVRNNTGIVVDQSDNIIIGASEDTGKKITMLESDGQLIRTLLSVDDYSQTLLAIDNNGLLYIGIESYQRQRGNHVKIVKYLK